MELVLIPSYDVNHQRSQDYSLETDPDERRVPSHGTPIASYGG